VKKNLYIIPGWEDTGLEAGYQMLGAKAHEKGYEVVFKKVDWTKPLSSQIFDVPKESVLFGFSLGAILAWLVAQDKPSSHLILASMTSHYSFTDKEILKALVDLAGEEFVGDITKNLKSAHLSDKQTILYGDREAEPADILVKDTDHELTENYIDEVIKLL
jgi:esterase/lipase